MLQDAAGTTPTTIARAGGNLVRGLISTGLALAVCYAVSMVSVNAVYALTLDRSEWVYGVTSASAPATPAVAGEPRVVQTTGHGHIAQVRMARPADQPVLVQTTGQPTR